MVSIMYDVIMRAVYYSQIIPKFAYYSQNYSRIICASLISNQRAPHQLQYVIQCIGMRDNFFSVPIHLLLCCFKRQISTSLSNTLPTGYVLCVYEHCLHSSTADHACTPSGIPVPRSHCGKSIYLLISPHVTKSSPSILSYCKRSNTGEGNSLGTSLGVGLRRREGCLTQVDERTQIDSAS